MHKRFAQSRNVAASCAGRAGRRARPPGATALLTSLLGQEWEQLLWGLLNICLRRAGNPKIWVADQPQTGKSRSPYIILFNKLLALKLALLVLVTLCAPNPSSQLPPPLKCEEGRGNHHKYGGLPGFLDVSSLNVLFGTFPHFLSGEYGSCSRRLLSSHVTAYASHT